MRVEERQCFTEERARVRMPSPPCSCVSELFLMILKGMEEEQARELDSTASASSEAVAEVAGCVSP